WPLSAVLLPPATPAHRAFRMDLTQTLNFAAEWYRGRTDDGRIEVGRLSDWTAAGNLARNHTTFPCNCKRLRGSPALGPAATDPACGVSERARVSAGNAPPRAVQPATIAT